jgi:pyrroline-5-carboxylate reductase
MGTGEIATALVRGLAGQGHRILVSERNADKAARLAADVAGVTVAANERVVDGSDTIFLCLLASVVERVLPGLPFRRDQAVISVMVDVPLAQLHTLCAPATDIAITIALPAVALGGCPLPVVPQSKALAALFGARNPVFTVRDEVALNAHFGATALCSPLLDQMLATTDWLSQFSGDAEAAEAYVCAVIRSCLTAPHAAGTLARTLQSLSTEGGMNAALRAAMAPALGDLRSGLDAFRPRLGLPEADA